MRRNGGIGMKTARFAALLILGGIVMLGLFGCGAKSRNTMAERFERVPEGEIIVDYYSATVATVGGDCHDEYVLYSTGNAENAKLCVYSGAENEEETAVTYIVPYEAVEKCYDAIDRAGFRDWNKIKDKYAIDGAVIVCKFREDDGTYVRVTTGDMPEDGKEKLSNIGIIIRGYISDEYLVEE